MSGWPILDPSDDRRLAEAAATGEINALAQIFDTYAPRLYDYCHALLRDRDLAAAALHDTLLAAWVHVGVLDDPGRLRPWLYALARRECLRRLRLPDAHGAPAGPGLVVDPHTGEARPPVRAPEAADPFAGEDEVARRMELRRMVHGALSGLGGRPREALDLLLRHALEPNEIAGVLMLADPEAARLAAEARARLDEALLIAIIARTPDCPEVAALTMNEPSPLPPEKAREVGRHVAECPRCAPQRERQVATGRLMQSLPVASMPDDLRDAVLIAATDPEYDEVRAHAAHNAEPFDDRGRPTAGDRSTRRAAPGGEGRKRERGVLPVVAAAVVVLLVVAAAYMVLPDGSGAPAASGSSSGPSMTDPEDAQSEPEDPTESPEPTADRPTPTRSSTSPSPSRTRTPSPSASTSSPPARGVLSVGGCSIPEGSRSCSFTVSARGGPVRWSVRSAQGVVASGGGTLAGGASAQVTATREGACTESGSGSVRLSPNGTAVVTWACATPPPREEPSPDGPQRRG
ncbi:sigma-70 family RNA polymerase sigma factor [Thermomonospora umbrina]|uniref:RNA polymerase sigma factor (Sigma-70 family) n=1 Tax=Thermomonospora umbrina TaxID=111806 RepID=A0A3D9SIT1_9ACTN|nr:sigma-70 family RNA polymerase sigma factor [Thermomonospora umbrina]REE95812.1 RNA polymerase sigma factor (sigma-70 family) [Thermomonospora umbrina]